MHCTNCGAESRQAAKFCAGCGASVGAVTAQLARVAVTAERPEGPGAAFAGQIVALVGGVLVAVGPTLPWASAGVMSVNGFHKVGAEAWSLVLIGVVAAIAALVSIVNKKPRPGASFVNGALSGALSVFYYVQINEQLSSIESSFIVPTIGFGMYACLVGAGLLVLGGAMGVTRR